MCKKPRKTGVLGATYFEKLVFIMMFLLKPGGDIFVIMKSSESVLDLLIIHKKIENLQNFSIGKSATFRNSFLKN